MFCSNCGTKLDDGARFCSNCGKKIEIPAPVQQDKKEEPPVPFEGEVNVSPVSDIAPVSDAVQEIKEEALPVTENVAFSAEEKVEASAEAAEASAEAAEETVEKAAEEIEEAVAVTEEKAEEIVSDIPYQVSSAAEAASAINEAPKQPEQPVYQQPPVYAQPVYQQQPQPQQYAQPQYQPQPQQYAQPQYQPQPQMQYAQPQYNQYGQPQYFDQYGRPVYFYPQQTAPVGAKKGMVWHYIFTCGVLILTVAMLVMFAVFSPYGVAYTEYRAIDSGDDFGEMLEDIDDFIEASYILNDPFKIVDISARIVCGLLTLWGIAVFVLLIMKKKASFGNLLGFGIVFFLLNLGYFLYWILDYSFEILADSAWTLFQFPVFALAGLVIMIINCVYYAKRKHQLK